MTKLYSIQYLRAVAALMVAVVHLRMPLERLGYDGWFPSVTAGGVDIFFVISGVVMWLSTTRNNTTAVDFLARRIIRIVPMYWLVTSLVVSIMLVAPNLMSNGNFNLPHVAASFMFIPWEHPQFPGRLFPALVPGWTINAEMFFYAIFGAALALSKRWRIVAVTMAFGTFVVAGIWFAPTGISAFYTNSFFLEFAFGLLIGQAFSSGQRISSLVAVTMTITGVAGLLLFEIFITDAMQLDRLISWGVPAALIVGGMMGLERSDALPKSRVLSFIGGASYSVYIIQPIPLAAMGVMVRSLLSGHPGMQQICYVPLAIGSVVATGCLVYLLIERRITTWLLRHYQLARERSFAMEKPLGESGSA